MKLTKSKERVRDFGEVFTPRHIVEQMLDTLPESMFEPETTYLEPCAGEGAMVLPLLERKFRHCKSRSDYTEALKSIYAMDIQADNIEILINNIMELCKRYFKPTKQDIQTINEHCIQCDSLKIMKLLEAYGGD